MKLISKLEQFAEICRPTPVSEETMEMYKKDFENDLDFFGAMQIKERTCVDVYVLSQPLALERSKVYRITRKQEYPLTPPSLSVTVRTL